jgi:D-alanyl-lipoteichoic acid acyltransferase DltB (MBOAT superfamily)
MKYSKHGVHTYYISKQTYIGLLKSCLEMYGQQQSEMCFTPTPIRAEWILTFICIILGILCVTTTVNRDITETTEKQSENMKI